jgi:DNA-binding MarR family transcriptional regulator
MSDTSRAALRLAVAIARIRTRLREEGGLHATGLSVTQLSVLTRVIEDGPTTAAALAAAEHVSQQAIAQAIAALKAEGLVATRPDPGDGRKTLIEASDEGERLRTTLDDSRLRWLVHAIEEAVAPEERASLDAATELLERLARIDK